MISIKTRMPSMDRIMDTSLRNTLPKLKIKGMRLPSLRLKMSSSLGKMKFKKSRGGY